MTAPTDVGRLHMQAIEARLKAALAVEQYPIHIGEVTTDEDDTTYPYLVIWPAPAHRPVITMTGYDGTAVTTTQITAAGGSPNEVLAALDRAGAALHRWQPSIPGRNCTPVTQDPAGPPPRPTKDERVSTPDGRPVHFSYIIVTFRSTPVAGGAP